MASLRRRPGRAGAWRLAGRRGASPGSSALRLGEGVARAPAQPRRGVMVLTRGLYITISGMARSYAAFALAAKVGEGKKWERGGLPSCQPASVLSTCWKSDARRSDAGTATKSPQWALLVASRSMLFG